jgi:hypothetical protein
MSSNMATFVNMAAGAGFAVPVHFDETTSHTHLTQVYILECNNKIKQVDTTKSYLIPPMHILNNMHHTSCLGGRFCYI